MFYGDEVFISDEMEIYLYVKDENIILSDYENVP